MFRVCFEQVIQMIDESRMPRALDHAVTAIDKCLNSKLKLRIVCDTL